ncbi:MAG: elongation factor P [Candidatus Hydrothermota bacterium]|nr:MAG: elongation factor P [Candidatus Hydrothermae bacterium]
MPDIRTGMAIKLDGEIYLVVDFQHIHMGRGGATIRTKLKNMRTGQVREISLRDTDTVEEVRVERRPAAFSYTTGDNYVFYDIETYEEHIFPEDQLKDILPYLKEGLEVTILNIDGSPLGIELPNSVVLEVVETDPGLKGDTASGGSKPAKLETGLVIQVPLFVQIGDKVRVDTRTGKYLERVKE